MKAAGALLSLEPENVPAGVAARQPKRLRPESAVSKWQERVTKRYRTVLL